MRNLVRRCIFSKFVILITLPFLTSCLATPKRTKADEVYKVEQGNEGTAVTCSGSPDCAVLGVLGAGLSLAELSLKPFTSPDVPGDQILILCRIQTPENKDLSYSCGASEVEITPILRPDILHFQGEKIVIPNLRTQGKYAITVKLRSCPNADANKLIKDVMPGQKVAIVFPSSCLEVKH